MTNYEGKEKVIASIPLGTNAVPTHKIVAVRKIDGDLVSYKLEDGTVIDVAQAVEMCEAGQLPDYRVGVSRADTLFIRNVSDGDPSNNLDNLPRF